MATTSNPLVRPLLILSLLLVRQLAAPPVQGQAAQPIAAVLERPSAELAPAELEAYIPVLQRYYAVTDYRPLWTDDSGITSRGRALVEALRDAWSQGLDAEDYSLGGLPAPGGHVSELAMFDVRLSATALRFGRDLGWGVTSSSEVDRDNSYDARPYDPDAIVRALAGASDPGAALLALAPHGPAADALRRALAELRAIRDAGGWKPVASGATLRIGDEAARVAELREQLTARGDLGDNSGSATFDESLAAALVRFQHRHGLEPDGIYGRAVVAELNVPVAARIQQVRLGLERLRWLPHAFTGRRIGVNLADFKVYVLDDDRVTFVTRAVVGKQYYETPMFTGSMTYVVINPYWNVPRSIAAAEILPRARRDPGYLARNHMEMDGASVRQLPGPWNSLGRFKFMFPNRHNVYLHDTPARPLFLRAERAFSHGCIRVERAAELAALLLGGQGWTPERIARVVETAEPTVVTLATPVPVIISYATAFLDPEDGTLHYRRDVYGRDRKLVGALARRGQRSWDR